VRFSWSGTGFVGAFTGTGISVRLSESGNSAYYSVLIDGSLGNTLITKSGPGSYVLGTGLTAGSHRVELYRRTEASLGTTTLLGLDVEEGKLETPPAARARSIEVVGDSITCGYGIEGKSASCPFTADTENHYKTFGAILARTLDADLFTVAWSGMGVVVNYGGDKSSERITQRYERAIGDEATSVWSFKAKPQAVIVNIGTNDYSATSSWTNAEFVSTYANLLTTIRGHYPDAYILCTIGPMLTDTELPGARANVKEAVNVRVTAGDHQIEAYDLQAVNDNPGCDWHPGIATHQAMADELTTELKARLSW
jgi:lysophospholipase L1-like esterase